MTREGESFVLDEAATQKLRDSMRKKRLDQSVDAKDFFDQQRQRVINKDFIRPVRDMYASSMDLSSEWNEKFRKFWDLPADWSL
jgi:N-methylhydantoinase B/acetone carboxylase alpha subunit